MTDTDPPTDKSAAGSPSEEGASEGRAYHLAVGMAMNVAASAECLVDDALAYAEDQTEENRRDFIASVNILLRRMKMAMHDLGEEI